MACVRSVAMVASTASPREPPTWRDVFSTPEARPASENGTPAVAAAASGMNSKPRASAMMQPGPNTCCQYEPSGVMRDSQAKPAVARIDPASSGGRTPVRGVSRELICAPIMMATAMGTNAMPARSAL
jgi:hypothetical protein